MATLVLLLAELHSWAQCAGLERSAALEHDIQWFEQTYGLKAPAVTADGPGATYARLLEELAVKDPQSFICHYYNFFFAHTAGGRMIGSKVSRFGRAGLPCVWDHPLVL